MYVTNILGIKLIGIASQRLLVVDLRLPLLVYYFIYFFSHVNY